jgi:hypothetical protein
MNDAYSSSSVCICRKPRSAVEGQMEKKSATAADKERLTVSLGIATGRRRSAANVLAVLAVLLRIGYSLCSVDLRLVEHDGRLALELLSHGLNCKTRWL